ncbi:hypothetical protein [Bradyrhizobium shewense]|nr:hypothetical protein [Bradyrhizobium zhanjiangense]MBB4380789.1 hypothetical protein [Bradyrhizobium sp. SBR1B]
MPQPDGPTIETNSPWATARDTRSTAMTCPLGASKTMLKSSTRMIA